MEENTMTYTLKCTLKCPISKDYIKRFVVDGNCVAIRHYSNGYYKCNDTNYGTQVVDIRVMVGIEYARKEWRSLVKCGWKKY